MSRRSTKQRRAARRRRAQVRSLRYVTATEVVVGMRLARETWRHISSPAFQKMQEELLGRLHKLIMERLDGAFPEWVTDHDIVGVDLARDHDEKTVLAQVVEVMAAAPPPLPRRRIVVSTGLFALYPPSPTPVESWMGFPIRIDPTLAPGEWHMEDPATGERITPR